MTIGVRFRLVSLRLVSLRASDDDIGLSVRRSQESQFCAVIIGSGRSVARLARLLGVQEVAGSNPAAPTSSNLQNGEWFL